MTITARFLRYFVSICFTTFLVFDISAQSSVVASGGNARSQGGASSFSIGQVFYNTTTGNHYSIIEGVQQPVVKPEVINSLVAKHDFDFIYYPNPIQNSFHIQTKTGQTLDNMSLSVIDLEGRLIINQKIINSLTTVSLGDYPSANYLVLLERNEVVIQSFKINKK